MADDKKDDTLGPDFYRGQNFLGRESSVSLTGQEPGPAADAGAAAGGAPVSGALFATPPSAGAQQGSVAGSGGRSVIQTLLDAAGYGKKALDTADKANQLFGASDPRRGETGGTSLSDTLRSADVPSLTPPVPPGTETVGGLPLDMARSPFEFGADLPSAGFEAGGGFGSEAAGAGTEAASTGAEAGLGGAALAGVALYPFTKSLMDWIMGVGPSSGKMHDTRGIRNDFSEAFPVLKGADTTFGRFANLRGLSPEDQIKELQGIAQEGGQQLGKIAPVSQFTSTEGGRHSGSSGEMLGSLFGSSGKVPALDVRGVESQTPALYMEAAVNSMLANDLLAQMGAAPAEGGTARHMAQEDPMGLLDLLSQQAGASVRKPKDAQGYEAGADPTQPGQSPYVDLDPADIALIQTPGRAVEGVVKVFSKLNPNFPQSPLGRSLSALGQGGTPPSGGVPAPEAAPAGGDAEPSSPFASPPPGPAGGTMKELEQT